MMILNSGNTIFSAVGVEKKELLKNDQGLIYRSPSKISTMGYAGATTRIVESTTIPQKYHSELTKMKGFISLGTTGIGQNKEHKNVHLYSEQAVYLDGLNRIGYLFAEGNELKLCEYKKGTRGSRYSSLYKILQDKLLKAGFTYDNQCFFIDEKNIVQFVNVINKINIEQNEGEYELIKNDEIDELSAGIFNVAHWEYKGVSKSSNANEMKEISTINHDLINKIESCKDIDSLVKLEQDITIILGFCRSKIETLKILKG
jgi:hypothetical protein